MIKCWIDPLEINDSLNRNIKYQRMVYSNEQPSSDFYEEKIIVTAEELEQREREAWENGRDIVTCGTYPGCGSTQCESFNDYLSSKSKESSCKQCGKSLPNGNGVHSCLVKEVRSE